MKKLINIVVFFNGSLFRATATLKVAGEIKDITVTGNSVESVITDLQFQFRTIGWEAYIKSKINKS